MRRVEKLFRPSEVYAMGLSLLAREQAAAHERMLAAAARGGRISPLKPAKPGARPAKISRALADRTFDRIAAHWGISGRQLEKIRDVCEAAEADPDRFGALLEEMDRTGKVNGPHTKLLRLRDEIRILDLAPVVGRFRTLVLDPPWQEDNISESCGHDYATMPIAEIAAVPVESWAEEDCHLYLWATNNTLQLAFGLLAGWGFQHKTVHTWTKPDLGFGRYFRNTTEHVIFAVRGELRTRAAGRSTRTDHDWPVGANSVKPEGFYDLVRACSYPPYGEAFQRLARPDFANLYAAPASMSEAAE
ncbi:MT-A70 family methyltransferase [Methylobacterium sp. J-072]|uniref:MT-A70 family methyltransferase n=1 Tax=Methylobacterium sp. J-072 TaxID=2836651 RepID=UPI001FB99808|nr:MT-A70 family methyltransferase [Methylobacterium sp. J-072]MCJ2092105.1 MT-A70 family methyltransferase [Methylobacterium sp. J-072]